MEVREYRLYEVRAFVGVWATSQEDAQRQIDQLAMHGPSDAGEVFDPQLSIDDGSLEMIEEEGLRTVTIGVSRG